LFSTCSLCYFAYHTGVKVKFTADIIRCCKTTSSTRRMPMCSIKELNYSLNTTRCYAIPRFRLLATDFMPFRRLQNHCIFPDIHRSQLPNWSVLHLRNCIGPISSYFLLHQNIIYPSYFMGIHNVWSYLALLSSKTSFSLRIYGSTRCGMLITQEKITHIAYLCTSMESVS
jgi:hypothetical protein